MEPFKIFYKEFVKPTIIDKAVIPPLQYSSAALAGFTTGFFAAASGHSYLRQNCDYNHDEYQPYSGSSPTKWGYSQGIQFGQIGLLFGTIPLALLGLSCLTKGTEIDHYHLKAAASALPFATNLFSMLWERGKNNTNLENRL